MIRQPGKGSRNVNDTFYAAEKRRIDLLNQALGEAELTAQEENTLIWLAGWGDSTVRLIISAFEKAK
ncbi:hypothetical protein [Lactonifactor longoviformis]|uniref:hypothetical protein n=1 Tax=Lactonifactor longoviformis TaxID=341220 RepID=UPI0036F3B12F